MKKLYYKKFSKNFYPLECLPKDKLIKFHKPKWIQIQKLILKNLFQLKFIDCYKNTCKIKAWEKNSLKFFQMLEFNNTVNNIFFNSISNKYKENVYKQKIKNFLLFFKTLLVKPEFFISILLFRLNFFFTLNLAKQAIKRAQILMNSKSEILNSLSTGDFIFVTNIFLLNFKKQLNASLLFHTFLEIDYYTNQFVVVKKFSKLTKFDLLLLRHFSNKVLNFY